MKDGERLVISGDMLPSAVSTACRSRGRKVVVVEPATHYHGEQSIADELDALPLPTADCKLLLAIHSPPWNTGLDVLFDGTHVGSRSVRHFIEKHRPLLALHGHIHESPEMSGIWIEHLGPTVCINPGHSPRRLHAVFGQVVPAFHVLVELPGLVNPCNLIGNLAEPATIQRDFAALGAQRCMEALLSIAPEFMADRSPAQIGHGGLTAPAQVNRRRFTIHMLGQAHFPTGGRDHPHSILFGSFMVARGCERETTARSLESIPQT